MARLNSPNNRNYFETTNNALRLVSEKDGATGRTVLTPISIDTTADVYTATTQALNVEQLMDPRFPFSATNKQYVDAADDQLMDLITVLQRDVAAAQTTITTLTSEVTALRTSLATAQAEIQTLTTLNPTTSASIASRVGILEANTLVNQVTIDHPLIDHLEEN